MKRLIGAVMVVVALGASVTVAYAAQSTVMSDLNTRPTPQELQPLQSGAWTCSTGTYFQTLNGQLSTATVLSTWHKVGPVTAITSALAYSPQNGYLYAIDAKSGANFGDLLQINSSGTEDVLGAVAGLSRTRHWSSGDIDPATNTYYVSYGTSHLYAIDLATMVAAPVALPALVSLGDDLIIQQGWLWSVTSKVVNGFSLTTGATKVFAVPSSQSGDSAGAMWSDVASDALYLRWDASGKVYQVTGLRTATAAFTQVATVATHGKINDGATCNAQVAESPDTAPALSVSGSLTSAFEPGALRRVNLVFTNSYPTPVTVWPRVIKIALSDSSPSCPALRNFAVYQGVSVAVTVPGNATKSLSQLGIPSVDWPDLSMLNTTSNQDACEGTTVTISYYVRYYG